MVAVGGEIWIAVSGEVSTVMVESALIEPNCAVMVAVPPEFAVTVPASLTLATVGADEVQFMKLVITSVLPSLNVPVTTYCT